MACFREVSRFADSGSGGGTWLCIFTENGYLSSLLSEPSLSASPVLLIEVHKYLAFSSAGRGERRRWGEASRSFSWQCEPLTWTWFLFDSWLSVCVNEQAIGLQPNSYLRGFWVSRGWHNQVPHTGCLNNSSWFSCSSGGRVRKSRCPQGQVLSEGSCGKSVLCPSPSFQWLLVFSGL